MYDKYLIRRKPFRNPPTPFFGWLKSEDVYLYKKYLKEIQDLREKEIIYSIEIQKIENPLANQ